MPAISVTRETSDGRLLCELYVTHEETEDEGGDPAAFVVSVDDELRGAAGLPLEALCPEEQEAVAEEIELPLVEEPRYVRDEAGRFRRVAYARKWHRDWIGGRGYVSRRVIFVWNPERGDLREAGEQAAPGERFAHVLTEAEFDRLTYTAEDLPPMGRAAARRLIERDAAEEPGRVQRVAFVKRTTGALRAMCFRYDAERAAQERFNFDPAARGLLSVFDVEKGARRFVNLDGVRTVAGGSPELA